ncbi:hypothetical protein RchiOBHm_Chr1g0368831 [Rosa chinensis]|uniref:Uncharacterized protein n=1 Tax=Rosa chinensis TaxID=74649 RepID=A0A2P6SKV4_ROSCH|nr:hypothetical protein RchiOBHm_Chr1g0368831 [Rosa chinensis]
MQTSVRSIRFGMLQHLGKVGAISLRLLCIKSLIERAVRSGTEATRFSDQIFHLNAALNRNLHVPVFTCCNAWIKLPTSSLCANVTTFSCAMTFNTTKQAMLTRRKAKQKTCLIGAFIFAFCYKTL